MVFNRGALAESLAKHGVDTIVVPEGERSFAALVREGLVIAGDFRPDIVHSHRYKEHLLGAFVAARSGAIHVRTAHGLPLEPTWNGRLRGAGAAVERAVADWTGSTWIAVSDELARRIAGMRRAVHVVPNGLPSDSPEPFRAGLEEAFDGTPSWYVGFVGRLEQVKRPDLFLRMLERLPRGIRGRAVRAAVVGDGGLRPRLELAAESLVRQGRLRFLGHRSDGDRILAALDALVVTSDHEGLPMVVLEAMRAAVPVVSTAVGGVPDALKEAGWLVPPDDAAALSAAVLEILDDADLRARRTAAARGRFDERFAIDRVGDRVLDLYRALLARPAA
jgi:glycosyltransferase involved in cell wall biosynthesis